MEIMWKSTGAPSEKYMLVNLDHFRRVRGENKKCLSCHHLEGDDVAMVRI